MQRSFMIGLSFLVFFSLLISSCSIKSTENGITQQDLTFTSTSPKSTETPTIIPDNPTPEWTSTPEVPDEWGKISPDGQQILFWHSYTGRQAEILQTIVESFNSTNPYSVRVIAEYQGGYADLYNKMIAAIGTQNVPDLVAAYQLQSGTFQRYGALLDLRELLVSRKWGIPEDDFVDIVQSVWTQDEYPIYQGARLGIPISRTIDVLYYNQDWLSELGYDAPPQALEEFQQLICTAKTKPFSGNSSGESIGFQMVVDASRLASWSFAQGEQFYDPVNNRFDFSGPGSVKAMEVLQAAYLNNCAQRVQEPFGDLKKFSEGKVLFTIGSSALISDYARYVSDGGKFRWGVAKIPGVNGNTSNAYGQSLSVLLGEPEREVASFLFIKYLLEPEIQALWVSAGDEFPVRISAIQKVAIPEGIRENYFKGFELFLNSSFEPPLPGYDFIRKEMENALSAILDGGEVVSIFETLSIKASEILSNQIVP